MRFSVSVSILIVALCALADPGASSLSYDLLLVENPADLASSLCLESGEGDTVASHQLERGFLLVRVINACGSSLGSASDGTLRSAPLCP